MIVVIVKLTKNYENEFFFIALLKDCYRDTDLCTLKSLFISTLSINLSIETFGGIYCVSTGFIIFDEAETIDFLEVKNERN